MANFSFGKFFGKSPRQPRFNPAPPESERGGSEANEALPVGRLVSFTDHGPEDAPLFQELETPPASPFAVVGGSRPTAGAGGGLPSPARLSVEEGFTADELAAMVPPSCVQAGAVPGNQVIPLPLPVLRASLAAGQPAVLLSQLHQACPGLFRAPTSLDQDLVIALPPQKVQRLVARAEAAGAAPTGPVPPAAPAAASTPFAPLVPPAPANLAPVGWTGHDPALAFEESGAAVFGTPPSRVKLPPPRRKFDDLHGGDLRPLIDHSDFAAPASGGAFSELGHAPEGDAASLSPPGFPSPFQKPAAAAPAAASPFQVTSALPHGQPPRGGLPKRFESPFAIVSPGDVPSVLESPFARHPVAGFDPGSEPPVGVADAPLAPLPPEPPATVSLRLTALFHGQTAGTLGFVPDRVPASVRVTLATAPLLQQVATGRIRVRVEDVVAGLDAKFQPAFKGAQPGLELHVPLRELFDNLPEAAPPTPAAPPVDSAFETPFSVRAEEDTSLTVENSPFKLAPPVPPAAPAPLAALPPAMAEAHPDPAPHPVLCPSPVQPAISLATPPSTPAPEAPISRAQAPFVVIPEAPLPPPIVPATAETPSAPSAHSPFLLIPADAASIPPRVTPPAVGETAAAQPPTAPQAPFAAHEAQAPTEPTPALAVPPAQIPPPTPLRNPFALAPGDGIRAGLGLELPMMPFDEDPVPLESLREEEPAYRAVSPPPPASSAAPAEVTPLSTPPSAPAPSSESVAAPLATPPAEPAPAPAPPALPPLLFVESPADEPERREPAAEPRLEPQVVEPPVMRIALSEREPMPPPADPAFSSAPQDPLPSEPLVSDPLPPLFSFAPPPVPPSAEPVPATADASAAVSAADPTAPPPPPPASVPIAASPFLESASFQQLPPLPFELLGTSPPAAPEAPSAASAVTPPPAAQAPADAAPLMPPSLAEAPPFTVATPRPTDDDRAAFASVFAPSALAGAPDGTRPPLREMDTVPAITLAKLPPLGDEPVPPAAPEPLPVPPLPVPIPASAAPAEPALPAAPSAAAASPGFSFSSPAPVEDLSFGYVDDPTQLALRAVFATDRTLGTQDVVDLAAQLEGLRACLVHTPHASLHSAPSPDDPEDVRHFRERAGALFEKTASLVRELDPSAREQSFTLRTGKSVVSFFAVDDVCLAVLHAEPSFRPGVREKLTLAVRSVADMLTA